jgi:hypothetical protein
MPLAVEHIRRMRGGAQAHLLRCSDDHYYVVKFLNNPQHPRILVNELLATRLAAALGLPTVEVAVIEVPEELIALTADLCMHIGAGRIPCRPGRHFGARYPCVPGEMDIHDFLPDEQLLELENRDDFLGMLVFDKWTCNTNGRQAIFFRAPMRFRAVMIDQGFCFNAGEWNFPDAPLRGLYSRRCVYQSVRGMDAFEPWLDRLERNIRPELFDRILREIPGEWYDFDQDALAALVERLLRRRSRIPDLILAARKTYRQPFPNWT